MKTEKRLVAEYTVTFTSDELEYAFNHPDSAFKAINRHIEELENADPFRITSNSRARRSISKKRPCPYPGCGLLMESFGSHFARIHGTPYKEWKKHHTISNSVMFDLPAPTEPKRLTAKNGDG